MVFYTFYKNFILLDKAVLIHFIKIFYKKIYIINQSNY